MSSFLHLVHAKAAISELRCCYDRQSRHCRMRDASSQGGLHRIALRCAQTMHTRLHDILSLTGMAQYVCPHIRMWTCSV